MRNLLALVLALALALSSCLVAHAEQYSYEEPVEPHLWEEPDFSNDHAYSIALVGDTQYISRGDFLEGTSKMDQLFGSIVDTAKERKLEHVFVLGDITDMGYRNDTNLGYGIFNPPQTGEWDIAQKAILQMSDAGISYSLCRGNHDDYMIDDYFNVPAYTDQFKGIGGFFSDSTAMHPASQEERNPKGYVYWSALSGYHENSIVNSYKTAEICGTKYLFITVDFHMTMNVINWVNEVLERYSDHLAIVATHSYIDVSGNLFTNTEGTTHIPTETASEDLWEFALKNHENVLAVVCGHKGTLRPVYSTIRRGINGNVVRQILVNPQDYDLREAPDERGTQDTGMVLYMNFSEDGSKVTFDYYSTLLNKEMTDSDYSMKLYQTNPVANKESSEVNAQAKEPSTSLEQTEDIELQGNGWILPSVCIGFVLILTLLFLVYCNRKK